MRKFLLLAAGVTLAQAQQYSITTIAGGAPPPTPAVALNTTIGQPRRATADSAGNIYFSSGHSVFKMTPGGTLTVVAGNSRAGFSGDGGPALKAQLNTPQGLALDKAGNLYIPDSVNNRVRMVTAAGIISTIAGNGVISPGGTPNAYGDGGTATDANLHLPSGVAVDSSGKLYIADTGDNTIRLVTPDGIINRFAGDSFPGYFAEGQAATTAEVHTPSDVLVDSSGNVYIADTTNAVVRKVTTDGVINLFAGNLTTGSKGDNGAATSANLTTPMALAMDGSGNLFIVDNGASRVRKVDSKGIITTVAGNGTAGFIGDGGNPVNASLNYPTGIAVDGSGNIYIADLLNLRLRKISGGNISTVAGNGVLAYSGDNGAATSAQLNAPQGLAADKSGSLFIADTGNNVVRQVAKNGTITTFVGSGGAGSGGNELSSPQGVASDASSGNVFIADTSNSRVQKVAGSTISTLAGNTAFYTPVGGAVDAAGNLYVADLNNNVVRKISPAGDVSTVAGTGSGGFSGDAGPAANARLNAPQAVAVDAAGNLYIADSGNYRVRRVTANGQINTVAGNGLPGFAGDGGPALLAQIGAVAGVAVDAAGNLYLSDGSVRVRKVTSGFIFTIAGNGTQGYSGDGSAAPLAQFNGATALSVDAAGNVYVADTRNNAVRVLQPGTTGVSIGAVTNAASNLAGPIAPGELITIYGSGLGPAGLVQFQLNSSKVVPTSLAGTSVFVNGAPAPVLYTSSNQVGAVVPFGLTGSTAQVVVTYQAQVATSANLSVEGASPGVFQLGPGQVVAINQDGSINGADHPAPAGSVLTVFGTGAGQTNPVGQDGAITGSSPPLPVFPVTATIGGKSATLQYNGSAPSLVQGVIQVNAFVPSGLTAGPVPLVVSVGGVFSQPGVVVYVGN